jgi:hypothetical protein
MKLPKKIKGIFLHCSDSDISDHDDISVIDRWHKERGWNGVGYSWFCKNDGTLQIGRQEYETQAAVRGYNKEYIHICFSGRKFFTDDQFNSVVKLCKNLMFAYNLDIHDIKCHYEVTPNKTCPNFSIESFRERFK